ncbi:hypothetical protein E2A64_08885 [Pseudohoeflea suaedae]|uniref:PilZ domain-containing protein n=1 Tax=Pseudohoeflea suaedae TaxID=877384 RepID=A0A4R5PPY8_9HYPH|nr:hypothetical protein [Pseudohoeflea suaedae]TDH39172.1 hypothetical protein E2A64_08885 [Pseudohoeflea suaedae]
MSETKHKRHQLTKIGDELEQRVYYPRDAGCPVAAHVRRSGRDERLAKKCWLVNISEDGCLLTGDDFPARLADVYIVFPGLGAKVLGHVRGQGDLTLQIQFEKQLPVGIVTQISRITPAKSEHAK